MYMLRDVSCLSLRHLEVTLQRASVFTCRLIFRQSKYSAYLCNSPRSSFCNS